MQLLMFLFILVFCGVAVYIGRPSKFQGHFDEAHEKLATRLEWANGLTGHLPEKLRDLIDSANEHKERSLVLWRYGYRQASLENANYALGELDQVKAMYGELPEVRTEDQWFRSS